MRTLLKIKENKPYSNHTLGIKIGSVSCALKCQDTVIYDKLQRLYHNFLTDELADVTIELKPVNRLSPEDLSAILSRTRFKHKGNSIRTTSRIMRGRYDLARHTISITGEGSLIDPDMEFNHLNKLLTAAYYSACKIKYDSRPPAMLVHACGILRYGQALVFTGPSDAGKSTIARLFDKQHGEVINDEMLLMSRPSPAGNSVSIQSAPIIGDLLPGRNTSAPLRCILLLKQSHKTAFHYLDKVDAHLRFMRQIISPVCIGQKDKRSVYSMIADFSAEVTSAVPVYELEFNLDEKSLWQITGDL
jgi:hypothetical protein